ncbi:hypothetical protein G4V62_16175 [Bacillaceae bacterium SIJ1]|uniref:hypothetical protein n=1 Tax=Litoribacterium kuwaitense TaxID=1398745 RepID=UPI0013EDB782|nr:hypothetical protein [Litoribacterium kuwaitense]NGP46409.1 hypothetical protein [Litoribacterium kuwaitense]
MRVIWHECKKVIKSPIFLALMAIFIAYNMFLIISAAQDRSEAETVNAVVEQYGVNITSTSLAQLQGGLQRDTEELNRITRAEAGQTFDHVFAFLERRDIRNDQRYSEADWAFINQLLAKEMYFQQAQSNIERYEQLDWSRIAEDEIFKYQLNGQAAQVIKDEYTKLSERYTEIINKGEHKEWFFAGEYRMHSFLFRTVFGSLIFEALILIVLATALITNYEFEHRTHFVTYTTKRGRRLMKDKLLAALIIASGITVSLFIVTLGTYFLVFDYAHVWGSSINSVLNWEYKLPYVSWWDFSFGNYLFMSIGLVFLCMLLFSALTFGMSVLIKNSYATFFVFALFFLFGYLVGNIPGPSIFMLLAMFNLSALLLNPHLFLWAVMA